MIKRIIYMLYAVAWLLSTNCNQESYIIIYIHNNPENVRRVDANFNINISNKEAFSEIYPDLFTYEIKTDYTYLGNPTNVKFYIPDLAKGGGSLSVYLKALTEENCYLGGSVEDYPIKDQIQELHVSMSPFTDSPYPSCPLMP